ncbi:hypothetical protein [Bacillus marinisedimentorum]|uniref:hypothetical protein n=1 Tax=Bacillus marinisedimentorum TaxID=1821260 RepID=UPI0007DF47C7|nr:hypothetical protein [Bacillus marinisedimentorum]
MKKYPLLIALLLALGVAVAGCNTAEEEKGGTEDQAANETAEEKEAETEEKTEEEPAEEKQAEQPSGNGENVESGNLEDGVQNVRASVEELGAAVTTSPERIKEQGETVEKEWDAIEKQVEEKYPDEYAKIEEGLYPLIDETKKDSPDSKKITTLVEETSKKLKEFQEKVGGAE